MIELFEIIGKVSVVLSALLALGIILKFNKLSTTLKIVGIYLIASASIDIITTAYFDMRMNNLVFLHLFTLVEFVILSHLFKCAFIPLKSHINIYYVAIPVTIFIILNSIFIQNIYIFNSFSAAIASVVILGYCIHFFYLILDYRPLNYQFIVLKWFVICLFFFHSISLIIMFFGNLINTLDPKVQSYIWLFRGIIFMTTKIILAYCFVKLLLFKDKLVINE